MRTISLSGWVPAVFSMLTLTACGSDSTATNVAAGGSSGVDGSCACAGALPTGGATSNGGSGNGGSAGGGAANGGSANGGSANGGAANGGAANGGSANGGAGNGGAGNGGTTNTGGATGTGGAPFTPTGTPITAPNTQWTWIDFPDTKCRDNSASGLGVLLNSASTKVMIYLEGGGACFDPLTCATNPANSAGQHGPKTGGLFDRSNAANPVRDWNFVYVPYCTGDVHAGTNDAGSVSGVTGVQHFVGRLNMEKYLNRIVPTFPNATQVLLTGVSAGGFGAAASGDLVQHAFGSVPVTLIDDSGPPMSSQYLPACLQDGWRTTWGLDGSILKDCGADCPNHSDFTLDFAKHLSKTHPNTLGGLVETTGDSVITLFFGFGANNCTGGIGTPVSAATFQAGLLDFRSQMQAAGYTNFGTNFISGTQHTWLGGASLYTQTTGNVKLIDWVANIVNGTGAANVGP